MAGREYWGALRAQLAQRDGALQEALELYEDSLEMYRDCNDMGGVVITIADIGTVALLAGNIQRAIDVLSEAAQIVKAVPAGGRPTLILEPVGCLMASLGDPTRASILLSAARSLPVTYSPARLAPDLAEYNRCLDSARAQLDETTWNQAWARGQAMSIEEALQFASDALATLNSHSTT